MPYTKKYYLKYFENYGFQLYFRQLTYGRGVNDEMEQRYYEKAERIAKNPKYTFERLETKKLAKYTEDFRNVDNQAWVNHAWRRR